MTRGGNGGDDGDGCVDSVVQGEDEGDEEDNEDEGKEEDVGGGGWGEEEEEEDIAAVAKTWASNAFTMSSKARTRVK